MVIYLCGVPSSCFVQRLSGGCFWVGAQWLHFKSRGKWLFFEDWRPIGLFAALWFLKYQIYIHLTPNPIPSSSLGLMYFGVQERNFCIFLLIWCLVIPVNSYTFRGFESVEVEMPATEDRISCGQELWDWRPPLNRNL